MWLQLNKLPIKNYKIGDKYGLTIEWFENGQKKEEGEYINNYKTGTWQYWDKEGNKTVEELYNDDDNGKLIKTIEYIKNSLILSSLYSV